MAEATDACRLQDHQAAEKIVGMAVGQDTGVAEAFAHVQCCLTRRHPASARRLPKLRCMDDAVTELAAYFRARTPVPDDELIRLTSAARAGGHTWFGIAAACGVKTSRDADGIVSLPSGRIPQTGAGLLYRAAQGAVERVTGSRRYPPLTWPCACCGRQVADRATTGRPIHIEHGHATDCARLGHDQAADADARRARLPALITTSEHAVGALQRHRLTVPVIDDCPRCGWHGYFHEYLATIDGDWGNAVCDNCYADLHPAITVSVRLFSARSAGSEQPFAVIRERARSDYQFPDLGQQLSWQLSWEHTTLLAEDARSEGTSDVVPVSRDDAERIAAGLAVRYWPPDAAHLPWITHAYPQ